jgi:autotransporter-associated beta strand protein
MNHNYKVVFNRRLGASQVVSEHTRGRGKSKPARMRRTVLLTAIATAMALLFANARADDNLLVGIGGNGGIAINLGGGGGGGGIGGGGGNIFGNGGGIVGGNVGSDGGIGGEGGGSGSGIGSSGGGGGIGGSGGAGAGGAPDGSNGAPAVRRDGTDISGVGFGAGAGTAGGAPGASSVSFMTFTPATSSYAFVGVGGGGGGGGINNTGDDGSAGDLTVNGTVFTITRSLLIGGGGGGGGLAGGGNGGDGSVTLDGAGMSVAETLLVGGSGGGGGRGGNGGNGVLTMTNDVILSVNGGLILGGAQGDVGGGTGGVGGAGIFNLGAGSVSFGSGATFTINANGTLNIGNASAGGTNAGTITGITSLANNGAVNFNQSDASYTFGIAMSGSGSVTQNAMNTTILTGENTYTGGTTISAGTLQIGNGSTTGSIVGNVVDNATLDFNRSNAVSYNGVISGTGGLVKDGAGTMTLIGANTYTGGTTINAGTLALSGSGNLASTGAVSIAGGAGFDISGADGNRAVIALSGTGNVVLGANSLTIDGRRTFTFSGVIGGRGGVVMQGTGEMTLDGANTYTGDTIISAGTLQIGSGGTTGSIAGNVVNNATLDFNRSDAVSYNGVISGSGNLIKDGTGTTTLTGENTYTGGATINAGTLQIGNGGTTGSVVGDIVNNATLAFNRSDAVTYGNAISGSGNLIKDGAGTTILTGFNTYTGGTTISAGTLQIGNSGTVGSIIGNIIDNATVAVDRSDNIAYFGVISGTGSIIKHGTNTLTLTGANIYTGNTTIDSGTLQFDTFSQNAGQLLRIGAAGNMDYGKLAVTGAATFTTDAQIDVNVAGMNTLASGQTLSSVISAAALHASTFDVTDNSALFNFNAVLNGNNVDLTISQASVTHSGVLDAVLASGATSADGAARVLDNLINAAPSGDMANVITSLGTLSSQRDVSRAVTQTLPLLSGGVAQSTLGMLGSFNSVVQNRLTSVGGNDVIGSTDGFGNSASGIATGENAPDRHVWAKAFGSRADQDDHSGASGFSANSWGTAFGTDSELAPGTLLGISYAYASSSVDGNTALSGATQHANIDSNLLGIYGSHALPNNMQLDFQADVGRNHTDGSRQLDFSGLNRSATSSYVTYSAHVGTALSKDIALNERTTFTPAVRIDYTRLRDQGYSEAGADALNLNVDANTTEALVFGAEGRIRHALTERSWLSVNLGAGYDAINDRGDLVSVYAGAPGQSFTTTGIDHSPWLIDAGIGYTYQASSGMQAILRYDVDGRDGYVNQTASVKASWTF